jgi:hypothetical protein
MDEAVGGLCEAFLAPRVLIKEATADVEILVIAGWQGGPFVFFQSAWAGGAKAGAVPKRKAMRGNKS